LHSGRLGKSFEMIRKIEIERFSLTSSKPFDQVVAAVNAGVSISPALLKPFSTVLFNSAKERAT